MARKRRHCHMEDVASTSGPRLPREWIRWGVRAVYLGCADTTFDGWLWLPAPSKAVIWYQYVTFAVTLVSEYEVPAVTAIIVYDPGAPVPLRQIL